MNSGRVDHYHYPLYTFQHNSEFLKSNFSQIVAKIINNGEVWVAKLDVGADESIELLNSFSSYVLLNLMASSCI